MDKETKEKYVYPALSKAGTLIIVMLVFFVLYRAENIKRGLYQIMGIVKPFLYGGVMAYLLRPSCNFFDRWINKLAEKCNIVSYKVKKASRGVAIVLSMILFTAIIYTFVALVLPELVSSIVSIFQILPANINKASRWLEELSRDNEQMHMIIENATDFVQTNLRTWMDDGLMTKAQALIAGVSTQVWNIVIVAKNFFIGLVVCVYLLSCKERMAYQGKLILLGLFGEKWSKKIREELYIVDDMFEGFINGKLIDSLIIGIICFIVMSIFDWPYAMLISTIIGVTNIIPFFGPFIGAVPSALLMLMASPVKMIYLLIFILILQQFDGNILGPKILGNSTGLSGFWVLFSITVFGGLYGIVGMVIGVPVFAVIYDLIKKTLKYLLNKRRISKEAQEEIKLGRVKKE